MAKYLLIIPLLFVGAIAWAAPTYTLMRSILPELDSTYELGTSTRAWLRVTTDEICLAGDCEVAWPSGSGSGLSTSTPWTAGQLAAVFDDGTLYGVSTTTPTIGNGLSYSGTFGNVVGGVSGTLTATLGTTISPSELAGQPFSDGTLLYPSGSNFASVATSTLTINAPLTTSGTPGYLVGGTNLTIDIDDIKAADLDLSDITLADFTNDAGFLTSSSIDTSAELAAIVGDETGTAGNLVFSGGPTFTGLTTLANYTATNGTTTNATSTTFFATTLQATNAIISAVTGVFDLSNATVKQHLQTCVSWPPGQAMATTTTATTTIELGPTIFTQTWHAIRAHSNALKSVGFRPTDGTNHMDFGLSTTTAATTTLSTNNTFSGGERRLLEVGPMTNGNISLCADVTQN